MTLKGYFLWFRENWPKVGVIVGLFLTIYLIVIVLPQSTVLFALLMSTPLYMLHEADEYIFPGGFARFMNQNIYRMNPKTELIDSTGVFWGNMLVWMAFTLYSLWAVTDEVDSNIVGDWSRTKGDCDRGKAAYAGKAGLSSAKGTHY
jgi:hypothetical protein